MRTDDTQQRRWYMNNFSSVRTPELRGDALFLPDRHSPDADAGCHLSGVDDLQQTRFVGFTEPPNSTQVIRPHGNTTCKQTNKLKCLHSLEETMKPHHTPDDISKYFLVLTIVEQGGGADLSHGSFQLEAERVTAAGVHTGRTSTVVLQLHSVEVWGTALRTRASTNTAGN